MRGVARVRCPARPEAVRLGGVCADPVVRMEEKNEPELGGFSHTTSSAGSSSPLPSPLEPRMAPHRLGDCLMVSRLFTHLCWVYTRG